MHERPKTIPELRGMARVPTDRTKKYSVASYTAQYGITREDAEEIVALFSSHQEAERAIFRMYSENPALRDRAINWHHYEQERDDERRRQVDKQREEERQKKIEEANREEAEREKAKKALAEKQEVKA